MVAEASPTVASESRNANENPETGGGSTKTVQNTGKNDTIATKSEHNETEKKESSQESLAETFQPPMASILAAPPPVTLAPSSRMPVELSNGAASLTNKKPTTMQKTTQGTTKPVQQGATVSEKSSTDVGNARKEAPVSITPTEVAQLPSQKTGIVSSTTTLTKTLPPTSHPNAAQGISASNGSLVASGIKRVSFNGAPTKPEPLSMSTEGVANYSLAAKPKQDAIAPPLAALLETPMDRARAPLVSKYGPYIHPSDTSLKDARERLLKAIEQIRTLRSAFTERVFKKYRILLKPVPASVDAVINGIKADPKNTNAKLVKQIRAIKEEKELEKKEGQKLLSLGLNHGPNGESITNPSSDSVDQYSYLTAGLSLVLLPEADAQDFGIDLSKYPCRGPTRPETGQRVAGISAAAATAAEMCLDRVRRAAMLRADRQRRIQMGTLKPDGSGDTSNNHIVSRFHLFTSATSAMSKSSIGVTTGHSKSKRGSKAGGSSASGKANRNRGPSASETSSMLSMNPLVEDIATPGSNPSAATSALLWAGVGTKGIPQRWQHPFPDSYGGRRSLTNPRNSLVGPNGVILELPIPTRLATQKRKFPVHEATHAATGRASKAIQSVLSQFALKDHEKRSETHGTDSSASAPKSGLIYSSSPPRKRRATEIRLMHGMHRPVDADGKISPPMRIDPATVDGIKPVESDNTQDSSIEPIIAFSVLHALGLVHDGHSSPKGQTKSVKTRLSQIASSNGGAEVSAKVSALMKKVSSKKRSFSEAFVSERKNNPVGQSIKTLQSKDGNPSVTPPKAMHSTSNGGQTVVSAADKPSVGADNAAQNSDVPVLSIRGGGVEANKTQASAMAQKDGAQDKEKSAGSSSETNSLRPKSAPSTPFKTRPQPAPQGTLNQRMRASASADGLHSEVAHGNRRAVQGSLSFSPQRNACFGLAANRFQAQQHLHPHAAALSRLPQASDLVDYLGAGLHQRQGYHQGSQDWSAIASSQAAVGLLPSSLASLAFNPHQAALLDLGARERAARALLAREQQAAVHVAAVQRQASAALRAPGVHGLTAQQAVALMGQAAQGPAGLFAGSATYGQLGSHAAANASAILSSRAAALMSQSQIGQQVAPNAPGGSRPGSRHSVSSIASISKSTPMDLSKPARDRSSQAGVPDQEGASKRKTADKDSGAKKAFDTDTPKSDGNESETRAPPAKKPRPSNYEGINMPNISHVINEISDDKPDESSPAKFPGDRKDGSPSEEAQVTPGMEFFVPPIPPTMNSNAATSVLEGRIHVAIANMILQSGSLKSVPDATMLLDFLQATGSAVPIPKALVANPLKERLNVQSLKTSSNGTQLPTMPRDLVASTILVWLWVQHKDSFQRAFAKSGRIDVDPECKWLIQAAVDAACRAVIAKVSDAVQKGGPLATAISLSRSKAGSTSAAQDEAERQAAATVCVDTYIASIVSEALMTELCIDEEVDSVLPMFDDLVQLLDETRLAALRAKCRERAFLAALVSRRCTMSESFSNAYVSSMVRAGEALGHGELFEVAQDEETGASTMIPYDIFSDETGAWEDPCRPSGGFTPQLSGEDLVNRAHARAMIQKSLKKMQDRNNIRGGAPEPGPYIDRHELAQKQNAGASESKRGSLSRTPSGLKRRSSSFSFSGGGMQLGTGSGKATSSVLYNPQHQCQPLVLDSMSMENQPYGRYCQTSKPRAFSGTKVSLGQDGKDLRRKSHERVPSTPQTPSLGRPEMDKSCRRSTEEVFWTEIAQAFHEVHSSGSTPSSRRRSQKSTSPSHAHAPAATPQPNGRNIFAPFCNRIDDSQIPPGDSDAEDEDISDEAVLSRHRIVLDEMKQRLDKFMEGRTTAGQRARQRAQARAAERAAISGNKSSHGDST